MRRYIIIIIITIILISLSLSTSYAVPDMIPGQAPIQYKTTWMKQSDSKWGCKILGGSGTLQNCTNGKGNHPGTIWESGCALTSLTMLDYFYGMFYPPDPDFNNFPKIISSTDPLTFDLLDPGKLNDYLVNHSVAVKKLNWTNALASFYYDGYPFPGYYTYMVPDDYCTAAGFPGVRDSKCYVAEWSDPATKSRPTAKQLLDNDIVNLMPQIVKIKGTDAGGTYHEPHFVLVAGYDQENNDTPDNYSIYDPGQSDPTGKSLPVPFSNLYRDFTIVRVYRIGYKNSLFSPRSLWYRLMFTVHSPVEIEIIDPQGRRTGYDATEGLSLQENPLSLYYKEDTPDGIGPDPDPEKILQITEPVDGNYILKIAGTGDGPYTIDVQGVKTDGTNNISTSLTGTATPGMALTYRVSYSSSGDAALSQANQAPIANAGSPQTGEQSYVITLNGSASYDPDGDPLRFAWSFLSKPNNSIATLSNPNIVNPQFTPDIPGTYILQLTVNDGFTDSIPSTVTVTVIPLRSHISLTPNYSTPLTAGSGFISFNANNVGRIGVSSGVINITLTDPNGQVVTTGSQAFGIGVGENKTISIPVTIPPLTLGNYTLNFTQSDETQTGTPTAVTVPNSTITTFTWDKLTYRVPDTANLTVNVMNTGKFNIDTLSVMVYALGDPGYTNTQSISLGQGQTRAVPFTISIPSTYTAGWHNIYLKLISASGSWVRQSTYIAVQNSSLVLALDSQSTYSAGGTIILTVENQGAVATSYTTQTLTLTDNKGNVLYQGNPADVITAGAKQFLANIQIPNQVLGGTAILSVALQDTNTGNWSYLNKSFTFNGLQATLLARTDKDTYTNTEAVSALTTLFNGSYPIDNGTLNIKVSKTQKPTGGEFKGYLPNNNWYGFYNPASAAVGPDGAVYVVDGLDSVKKFDKDGNVMAQWSGTGCGQGYNVRLYGIAASNDGSIYVTDSGNDCVQKFDKNGTLITQWSGQFNGLGSIAVGPDGSIYVVDIYNSRIQKFDANGNFISKWGSYGNGDGMFEYPYGVAVGSDGSVYVADTNNHRLQKFDAAGNFILKWGSSGSGNGQFSYPEGVTTTSDGFIYVADSNNNRIQKFDGNGQFISKWGSSGSNTGQFLWPDGIAISTDYILVADSYNHRIQKFDLSGNFIAKWENSTSGNGHFKSPAGVANAPDGSLYVADTSNNQIQKFDANGNFLTKWGSSGSGSGQFSLPAGVAVGPDGAVYVADTYNNRIQKFDVNGSFITKWGSYGGGSGQFGYPQAVAVDADGFVYVADTQSNRVQKFDNNGNFITTWGDLASPNGIAVGPGNFVYVTNLARNNVQKYDSNGNYITAWGVNGGLASPQGIAVRSDGSVFVTTIELGRYYYMTYGVDEFDADGNSMGIWGSYGNGDGQFSTPLGVSIGPDGSVYVADSANNRIQKMSSPQDGGQESLFETEMPVMQPTGMSVDYPTDIGALNFNGKLYLEATLKNSLGQTVATAEYPFSVMNGNTVISITTDKKMYRTNETVIITGEVKNLSATEATNVIITTQSRETGAATQTVYSEIASVPANGSHLFTTTVKATEAGVFFLTGAVTQNNTPLSETTEQYEVADPQISLSTIAPDIVNRDPFSITVQIANTGKINANLQYSLKDSLGNTIANSSLTIAAGETRLLTYTQQITRGLYYTTSISGDFTLTQYRNIRYGEGARVTIGSGSAKLGSGVYPEGKVSTPVTITNSGLLDNTITVTYSLTPSGLSQTTSYFIPPGQSVIDTLAFDVVKGAYQLTAVSSQPYATAAASFTVLQANDVTMNSSVGTQGSDGSIPVTVNIANNGYNVLNGTVSLAVMNNQGKAVWRGDVPVSGLQSQTSANFIINVNSTGILSGAYPGTATLYNSSGVLLVTNQFQVNVLGPIFAITSTPSGQTYTVGKQATLNFTVQNTGTSAGTASLSAQALNLVNQFTTVTLQPGQSQPVAFNFTIPDDALPTTYQANYSLSSELSQGITGTAPFNVAGINVGVNSTLDKQVYNNNDSAVLNLAIAKQASFDDGTFIAIVRYGSYASMQTFTLTSQPASLTFNVPLGTITGDRLFYGVYFQSGTKIFQSSVEIKTADTAPPVTILTVGTPQYARSDGTLYITSATPFTLAATDDLSGVAMTEYQIDGGIWNVYSSFTLSTAGTHTISYRSTDSAGNIEPNKTITVSLDNTAPAGSISINNGGQYANNTAVTLALGCTDLESDCSQMQFSNDNTTWSTPEPYTPNKIWSLTSGDNSKIVYVKYINGVGLISGAYSAGITLDTTPPVTAATPAGGLYNWAKSVVLASNEPATIYYTTDGTIPSKTSALYMGPITITAATTLNFFGVDLAGNTETPVKSATYTIDTQDPALTLSTLHDGAYTNNATLNIAGMATDNTAVQGVTINGTAVTVNADGSFSQAITLVSGPNTITTIATDTAGNTTKDVRTITLDETAPVITITAPADNSVTNIVISNVTGTVDKTATVTIQVNGGSPVSADMTETSFNLPVTLAYSQNTIQVTATDLAGNIGTAKRTVTLDNQNPSLSVTYPAEDVTTNQDQITLTGQVSDLTPVTVTVAVDGNVFTPALTNGSFAQTITFTVQKTYQINVTAVDEAGNQSLVQRNVIYNVNPQNLGVFGATGVSISGGYVDSYDSTQGAYNGVHGSNVSVGTNSIASSAINLSGGAADYGDAYVGPGGDPAKAITKSGGAVINGTGGALSILKNMTPMSDPGGGTPTTFNNGTTLTPGTYRVSSINLSGSGLGTINGNVTIYVTGSLSLSGSSRIVILPGGSLTIYLNGTLNVSGGAIVNQTLNPHNLTIYGTSTCTTASYSGSSALYGTIYTPVANTTISGGVNVYGAVIGRSVTISGGAAVHYDNSLGNIGN